MPVKDIDLLCLPLRLLEHGDVSLDGGKIGSGSSSSSSRMIAREEDIRGCGVRGFLLLFMPTSEEDLTRRPWDVVGDREPSSERRAVDASASWVGGGGGVEGASSVTTSSVEEKNARWGDCPALGVRLERVRPRLRDDDLRRGCFGVGGMGERDRARALYEVVSLAPEIREHWEGVTGLEVRLIIGR